MMKAVEAEFSFHKKKNYSEACQPQGQTPNVDEGINPVPEEISERNGNVTSYHIVNSVNAKCLDRSIYMPSLNEVIWRVFRLFI